MSCMHEPPREIGLQIGIAWHPRWWRLMPELGTRPPEGWRGGWSFTWLIFNVQRWWRYV
jgi:hypothetical protein